MIENKRDDEADDNNERDDEADDNNERDTALSRPARHEAGPEKDHPEDREQHADKHERVNYLQL